MAIGDLTTLQAVKDYARREDFADDAVISRLVSAASSWFTNQIQRDLTAVERTETYEWNTLADWPTQDRQTRTKRLLLRSRPVSEIPDDGVYIDGRLFPKQGQSSPDYTFDPATPAETQPGWVLRDDGTLELIGWWAVGFVQSYPGFIPYAGFRQIDVTYTGGYVTYDQTGAPSGIPGDVEQAVIEITVDMLKRRSRLGLRSQTVGGEHVVYLVDAIPPNIVATIDQYRRLGIG